MEETIENVIALGIILLLGSEGRDWEFYEAEPWWWNFRVAFFMWGGYWMHENELLFTLPLWASRR